MASQVPPRRHLGAVDQDLHDRPSAALPQPGDLRGSNMTQMIPEPPQELAVYKAVLEVAGESHQQRLNGTPEAYSEAAARYRELWRDYCDECLTDEGGD